MRSEWTNQKLMHYGKTGKDEDNKEEKSVVKKDC